MHQHRWEVSHRCGWAQRWPSCFAPAGLDKLKRLSVLYITNNAIASWTEVERPRAFFSRPSLMMNRSFFCGIEFPARFFASFFLLGLFCRFSPWKSSYCCLNCLNENKHLTFGISFLAVFVEWFYHRIVSSMMVVYGRKKNYFLVLTTFVGDFCLWGANEGWSQPTSGKCFARWCFVPYSRISTVLHLHFTYIFSKTSFCFLDGVFLHQPREALQYFLLRGFFSNSWLQERFEG